MYYIKCLHSKRVCNLIRQQIEGVELPWQTVQVFKILMIQFFLHAVSFEECLFLLFIDVRIRYYGILLYTNSNFSST